MRKEYHQMPKTIAAKKAQKKYVASRKRLSLLFTNEEYAKLCEMAKAQHTTITGVIRKELKLNGK